MSLVRVGTQIGALIFLTGCSLFGVASQATSFNVREVLNTALESKKDDVEIVAIPVDQKNNEKLIQEKLGSGLLLKQPQISREEFRAIISGSDSPALHLGVARLVYENTEDLKSAQADFPSEGYFSGSKILTPYRSLGGIRVLCIAYSETYLHSKREVVFAEILRQCVDS